MRLESPKKALRKPIKALEKKYFEKKSPKVWCVSKNSLLLHRNQNCNYYNSVKMETATTLDYLTLHGVKPSVQRLAVMEYLMEHHTHPTVDEIYSKLHRDMPTLSKTTVYNTLKLLTEQGAAIQLTIDERNVCFDADTTPHAHFLCTRCGKVYDIALRHNDLEAQAQLPEGFRTDHSALYFRGNCEHCALNEE